MLIAGDWRWRSDVYIGRDSAGLSAVRRRLAWRKPPSPDGAVGGAVDETVLDQPARMPGRHSVVVGVDGGVSSRRRTYRETRGRGPSPAERTDGGAVSSGCGLATARPLEWHSECADGAIRAHNTLSAEDTRVRVFYPFHPLCDVVLQVVRRPQRGDGAV